MKKAVIVHCWGGNPEYCWYPWAKNELEAKGFEVKVPAMPNTEEPRLLEWLPYLQETVGEVDENTYLIGHSVGCITILRFLEQLPADKKVGGVVLVAGFTDDISHIEEVGDELKSFFEAPILWDEIKPKANKFTVILSDDDPYVDLKYGNEFKEKLGAKIVVKEGMKHFSGGVDGEESCDELPAILEVI
jgi:hypothetical protein